MLISKDADIHHVNKVSDGCIIVQIKCVVTESLSLHMYMYAYMYVAVDMHVHTYLCTMCFDLICITVEWGHPITFSLSQRSP